MKEEEEKQLLINIQYYGNEYFKELKEEFKKFDIDDWWEGSKFVIGYCFYRGRRDELSTQYKKFAIDKIEKTFKLKDKRNRSESIKMLTAYFDNNNFYNKNIVDGKVKGLINGFKHKEKIKWNSNVAKGSTKDNKKETDYNNFVNHLNITKNEFVKELIKEEEIEEKKKICLNNDKDIAMVLSILYYMTNETNDNNLYKHILSKVKESNIREIIDDFIKKIDWVGDKLSNLIARDIVLLNKDVTNIEDFLNNAFPVDTWVKTLYKTITDRKATNNEIVKEYFITKSNDYKIEYKLDSLKIACGLWYLGKYSLVILIGLLNHIEV